MKLTQAEIDSFKDILVLPFNMEEITKVTNKAIQDAKAASKEQIFKPDGKYGLINGTNIVIDVECVGEIITNNRVTIPFHEVRNISIAIFPTFNPYFPLDELITEATPPLSLQEFMGDRFAYNNRIFSNMRIIQKEIKKVK